MFDESKKCDSDLQPELREIKRVIKEIVSSEVNVDGEESNPFKPITIVLSPRKQ